MARLEREVSKLEKQMELLEIEKRCAEEVLRITDSNESEEQKKAKRIRSLQTALAQLRARLAACQERLRLLQTTGGSALQLAQTRGTVEAAQERLRALEEEMRETRDADAKTVATASRRVREQGRLDKVDRKLQQTAEQLRRDTAALRTAEAELQHTKEALKHTELQLLRREIERRERRMRELDPARAVAKRARLGPEPSQAVSHLPAADEQAPVAALPAEQAPVAALPAEQAPVAALPEEQAPPLQSRRPQPRRHPLLLGPRHLLRRPHLSSSPRPFRCRSRARRSTSARRHCRRCTGTRRRAPQTRSAHSGSAAPPSGARSAASNQAVYKDAPVPRRHLVIPPARFTKPPPRNDDPPDCDLPRQGP